MKIRLLLNTFVRHAKDESVVWCPRTGGCTVMRNARLILEEVKREWRDVDFECLFVPAHVTGEYHLSFMEDRKYAIGVGHGLVDYSVGGADDLSKACIGRGWIGETFRRYDRPDVRISAQWSYGVPYLGAPALGVLLGKFTRNRAQDFAQLVACRYRPVVVHELKPVSISFSKEAKSSSSSTNSPLSNSLRDTSIMRLKAARLRQVSISSHVRSKSATLIITLVLRPFCVMTNGAMGARRPGEAVVERAAIPGEGNDILVETRAFDGSRFCAHNLFSERNWRHGALSCTQSQVGKSRNASLNSGTPMLAARCACFRIPKSRCTCLHIRL